MESGDVSDKMSPPCNPKRKDLTQKEWLKAIFMLVAMETEDSKRRGDIRLIAEKFGLAHGEQNMHLSWV